MMEHHSSYRHKMRTTLVSTTSGWLWKQYCRNKKEKWIKDTYAIEGKKSKQREGVAKENANKKRREEIKKFTVILKCVMPKIWLFVCNMVTFIHRIGDFGFAVIVAITGIIFRIKNLSRCVFLGKMSGMSNF